MLPKIGVIGGSGVYQIDGLQSQNWVTIQTPWGSPSDDILTGTLNGTEMAFLPRHGRGHVHSPTSIPYRANIDALKRLGCTDIIAVSAVGSLRADYQPGDFVLVDQYIDRTFARDKSFFGLGCVAHVSVAHPTCARLGEAVTRAAAPRRASPATANVATETTPRTTSAATPTPAVTAAPATTPPTTAASTRAATPAPATTPPTTAASTPAATPASAATPTTTPASTPASTPTTASATTPAATPAATPAITPTITLHQGATYLAIEGPQFSSLAESRLYRQWGADVIGMTGMPEAKLAREAEMCYASLAMVTDYDCWHPDHGAVDVAQVIATLTANAAQARSLIANLSFTRPDPCPCGCDRALTYALMTAPPKRDPDLVAKLDAVAGRVLKGQ